MYFCYFILLFGLLYLYHLHCGHYSLNSYLTCIFSPLSFSQDQFCHLATCMRAYARKYQHPGMNHINNKCALVVCVYSGMMTTS